MEQPFPPGTDPRPQASYQDPVDDPAEDFAREEAEATRAGRVSDAVLRRVESGIKRGLEHFADQVEDIAIRVDDVAGERLASVGERGEQAAGAASIFAAKLYGFSDYLRNAELDGLQQDLEDEYRARPARTLAISLGVGFVLAKVLRR